MDYWDRSKILICPSIGSLFSSCKKKKMQISSRRKINNNINLRHWAVSMCRHCNKRFTQWSLISQLSQQTHNYHHFTDKENRDTKGLSLYAEGHIVVMGEVDGNWEALSSSKPTFFTATLNNLPGCFHSFHFIPATVYATCYGVNTTQSDINYAFEEPTVK